MLERPTDHGGGRVVHDQGHTEFAPNPGYFGDRKHLEFGVRKRLAIISASLFVSGLSKVFRISRINKAYFDPHIANRDVKKVPGAPINMLGANEIIPHRGDIEDREQRCGLPRSQCDRGGPALHRCQTFFKNVRRRVHDSRVDVPHFGERE